MSLFGEISDFGLVRVIYPFYESEKESAIEIRTKDNHCHNYDCIKRNKITWEFP